MIIVAVISSPHLCEGSNRSEHNVNNRAGLQVKLFLNFSLVLLSASTLWMHHKRQATKQLHSRMFVWLKVKKTPKQLNFVATLKWLLRYNKRGKK